MTHFYFYHLSTKFGEFTEEELNIARDLFTRTGKPAIHLYFKDAPTTTKDMFEGRENRALARLNDELKGLGHFNAYFASHTELQKQFRYQINLYIDDVTPKNTSS